MFFCGLAILWTILLERNARIFKGASVSRGLLWDKVPLLAAGILKNNTIGGDTMELP